MKPRFEHTRSRTRAACSPTPPVKTIASSTTQLRSVTTDVALDPLHEHVDRDSRAKLAAIRRRLELAKVTCETRDPGEAGPVVEHVVDFVE